MFELLLSILKHSQIQFVDQATWRDNPYLLYKYTTQQASEHAVHLWGMWYVPEWIEKVVEHFLGMTPDQLKYIRGIVDFLFCIGSFSNTAHANISTEDISMRIRTKPASCQDKAQQGA
jgi:hypothetical protein